MNIHRRLTAAIFATALGFQARADRFDLYQGGSTSRSAGDWLSVSFVQDGGNVALTVTGEILTSDDFLSSCRFNLTGPITSLSYTIKPGGQSGSFSAPTLSSVAGDAGRESLTVSFTSGDDGEDNGNGRNRRFVQGDAVTLILSGGPTPLSVSQFEGQDGDGNYCSAVLGSGSDNTVSSVVATALESQPVPEPSTWVAAGFAASAALWRARHQGRRGTRA